MTLSDAEILRIATVVTDETVRRYHRRSALDREEIRSDAFLGIAKALRDNDGRAPVGAYAYLRARGEVLDGIRSRSPVSRTQHARGVTLADLPQAERPAVSSDEIEARLGYPLRLLDEHAQAAFLAIDDHLTRASLLDSLNEQQRLVVISYYWEGRTMREIAQHLGVTESRVCQVMKAAVTVLRAEQLAAA